MKPISAATLVILPLMFSACCSNARPRFWKVRDGSAGGLAYTVDTIGVPTGSLQPPDIRYVDGAGKYVDVRKPKVVREITEQEWKTATSGARYSLFYCGLRRACWAKTRER
ncbi:hypothetical protein JIN84_22380 [Luteolibacter yonseiensis]|uniref:Lipoprotein n=1 Tax=Luteolibacter yonseiensis TaxID=1144680 RepID=A0A934R9H5_9BACT|nr:hypothetical protein [Luteolibacter yonseiensis]MBK1818383.1 hypothetical protein [Luteolibacter yonseiensis]